MKSLAFLILTVLGVLGLIFVTVPGIETMFGAASGDESIGIVQIIATIVILWISTGLFIAMTLGGIGLAIAGFK